MSIQKNPQQNLPISADEKKARIIGSISVMRNSLELLKIKYGNYLDGYIKKDLERMERAIEKLATEVLD